MDRATLKRPWPGEPASSVTQSHVQLAEASLSTASDELALVRARASSEPYLGALPIEPCELLLVNDSCASLGVRLVAPRAPTAADLDLRAFPRLALTGFPTTFDIVSSDTYAIGCPEDSSACSLAILAHLSVKAFVNDRPLRAVLTQLRGEGGVRVTLILPGVHLLESDDPKSTTVIRLESIALAGCDVKSPRVPAIIPVGACHDADETPGRLCALIEQWSTLSDQAEDADLYWRSALSALVSALCDGCSTEEGDGSDHGTALCRAAACGAEPALRLLLNVGAFLNARDSSRFTPLHVAAICDQATCAALLLSHPDIDVNATDISLSTALHHAAFTGYDDIIRVMLAHAHIQPNVFDDEGRTPLHDAARSGNPTIVRMLLADARVDASLTDKSRLTALDRALERSESDEGCAEAARALQEWAKQDAGRRRT